MVGILVLTTVGSVMFLWAFGDPKNFKFEQHHEASVYFASESLGHFNLLALIIVLVDIACMSVLTFADALLPSALSIVLGVAIVLCKLGLLILFMGAVVGLTPSTEA